MQLRNKEKDCKSLRDQLEDVNRKEMELRNKEKDCKDLREQYQQKKKLRKGGLKDELRKLDEELSKASQTRK